MIGLFIVLVGVLFQPPNTTEPKAEEQAITQLEYKPSSHGLIVVKAKYNQKTINVLIDTGSNNTLITESCAKRIGIKIQKDSDSEQAREVIPDVRGTSIMENLNLNEFVCGRLSALVVARPTILPMADEKIEM